MIIKTNSIIWSLVAVFASNTRYQRNVYANFGICASNDPDVIAQALPQGKNPGPR